MSKIAVFGYPSCVSTPPPTGGPLVRSPQNFPWISTDGQGTKRWRKIAENFNRLSRAHERYRRQTDGMAIYVANLNVSSLSLKTSIYTTRQSQTYVVQCLQDIRIITIIITIATDGSQSRDAWCSFSNWWRTSSASGLTGVEKSAWSTSEFPISANWTFSLSLTAEACRNRRFLKGWDTLSVHFSRWRWAFGVVARIPSMDRHLGMMQLQLCRSKFAHEETL